ncbi:hypothetical protein DERP_011487 [Dermatophagoides pteronyssinus]|uniref:Transmembrane protein n=1 Tax=Dermatophagoides pteronyssinus TaxID=6956 RepID=A0ABQ8JCJ2_DERPT|nr:hypothetical protein DERP_011487 [Dermatophagoides pteronyssinus]
MKSNKNWLSWLDRFRFREFVNRVFAFMNLFCLVQFKTISSPQTTSINIFSLKGQKKSMIITILRFKKKIQIERITKMEKKNICTIFIINISRIWFYLYVVNSFGMISISIVHMDI